jgi:hypothetical protein
MASDLPEVLDDRYDRGEGRFVVIVEPGVLPAQQ